MQSTTPGAESPDAPPALKRFISDNDADPENQAIWIRRGERLGDGLAMIARNINVARDLRTAYIRELAVRVLRTVRLLLPGRASPVR